MSETDEPREFAAQFRQFLTWVEASGSVATPVASHLRDHLGEAGRAMSVIGRKWPAYDHVNLQVAFHAWSGSIDRTVEVLGVDPSGELSLAAVLSGRSPLRSGPPDLVDLPAGPATTLGCWRAAVLLVTDRRGPYAVLVRGPGTDGDPHVAVEVAGLATVVAQDVIAELATLRIELNVYRGQIVEFAHDGGGSQLSFVDVPTTHRDDVVLPEDVLRRIDRHTVDISSRRRVMRATRQHLKRGVLLYGPPGTGKTHTARYIIGRMTGSTVVMLAGSALYRVSDAAALARELQPAVVLLEDVDLVAEERGAGLAASPVLFELLDAMDGAGADADLLFVLTTNRPEVLEPALAHRPGRVDIAIEIGLPGPQARLSLFRLYGRKVPLVLDEADFDTVVRRTDGVTASFIKELLRRSVLEALDAQGEPLQAVRGEHVMRALDDLLDADQSLTRALLGGNHR